MITCLDKVANSRAATYQDDEARARQLQQLGTAAGFDPRRHGQGLAVPRAVIAELIHERALPSASLQLQAGPAPAEEDESQQAQAERRLCHFNAFWTDSGCRSGGEGRNCAQILMCGTAGGCRRPQSWACLWPSWPIVELTLHDGGTGAHAALRPGTVSKAALGWQQHH